MSSPEEPKLSLEDTLLRDDITEKFQEHANDATILEGIEELGTPLKIILYGKLGSQKPGVDLDVELTNSIYSSGEEQVTLQIGANDYTFLEEGVILEGQSDYYLGKDALMNLRFWLRKTRWQKDEVKPLQPKPQENT